MRGAVPSLLVLVVFTQLTASTRVTYNTANTAVCPPGDTANAHCYSIANPLALPV